MEDSIDNRPPAVKAACKAPGKYLFSARSMFFIEVDELGQVHQLTLKGLERDGLLDNAGWDTRADTQAGKAYLLTEVNPED